LDFTLSALCSDKRDLAGIASRVMMRRKMQKKHKQDAINLKRLGINALVSYNGWILGSTPILHCLIYIQIPPNPCWVRRQYSICATCILTSVTVLKIIPNGIR
jgi:hypothetical protein